MALGEDEQFDFKLPSPCSLKTPRHFVNLLSCQNEAAATPTSPRLADANAESFSFHVGGWFKNDGSSLPLVNADEVFHKWKLLSKSSLYPAAANILPSNDRKVNTPPTRTPSDIQRANSEGRGTQEFGIGSTRCRESRYGRLKKKDVIVIRGGSDKHNVLRKLTPRHKIFNEKGAMSLKKDRGGPERYHTTATRELEKKTFLPYHMNTMLGCINWDSTLNSIRRGFPLPSRSK